MDLVVFGLPATVALAAIAVLGYVVGRNRRTTSAEQASARRELKRAKAIIRDLETIARQIRRELAQHHANLSDFRHRVNDLARRGDRGDWQELADEAERLLAPTQHLATQLAHAYDGIRQQARQLTSFTDMRIDVLTGVSNRRALDEALAHLLSMRQRYAAGFAMAIFDIDHFKQINDEFGHLYGDRILQHVATLIDQKVRETDIVARFGGEEFIVLLPGTDLEGACIFAERIRVTVERLARATVSGGVTLAADGDDAKGILNRADQALYAAKADGRNVVFQHDGEGVQKCVDLILEDVVQSPRLAEIVA